MYTMNVCTWSEQDKMYFKCIVWNYAERINYESLYIIHITYIIIIVLF